MMFHHLNLQQSSLPTVSTGHSYIVIYTLLLSGLTEISDGEMISLWRSACMESESSVPSQTTLIDEASNSYNEGATVSEMIRVQQKLSFKETQARVNQAAQ